MKRLWWAIGIVVVLVGLLVPSRPEMRRACVGPNQSDVQTAVTAATYGDTVQVCAGSATWTAASQGCAENTMLCMKKGITLEGGIGGTTTITLSGAAPYGAIAYEPDATSRTNNTPFVFTGFTVDAGGVDYGEGMLDVRNVGTTALTQIQIHHNTFKNGADTGHAILINGPVYGVAYLNTMIDIGTYIKVEGGNALSWNLNHRAYGTVNSFFFEDNTIQFAPSSPVTSHGSTAGQGGSLVFRYNTINETNNNWARQLFDLHGLQSMSSSALSCDGSCWPPGTCYPQAPLGTRCCGQYSQVKSEIYGNKWMNLDSPTGGYTDWPMHRGSWMLMFHNSATGTYAGGSKPTPTYAQYACDECGPAGISMHVQNTYLWNNLWNGADRPMAKNLDFCGDLVGTYTIAENVDYYNLNASFDGTAGVGCGTLAARPATCTTGVAYWATSQSCSDLTGSVGVNPTTPLVGTLYKCKATNTWQTAGEAYTPYQYPHALRGATAPTAPTNVRIR